MSIFSKPELLPNVSAVCVLEGTIEIYAFPHDVIEVRVLGPPFVHDVGVQLLCRGGSQAQAGCRQLVYQLVEGNRFALCEYSRPVYASKDFLEIISPILRHTGAWLEQGSGRWQFVER